MRERDVSEEAMESSPYDRVTFRRILLLPAALLVAIVVAVAMSPAAWLFDWLLDEGSIARLAGAELALAAWFLAFPVFFAWRAGINWRELFGRVATLRTDRRWMALALALLALAVGTIPLVFVPLAEVMPDFVEWFVLEGVPLYVPGETLANALFFLSLFVVAPIGEEFLFRGLLLRRWTQRFGPRVAAGLTSLLFAVGHVDWLGAFVFGLVLANLARATGGLWAPIAVHALNNLLVWIAETAADSAEWTLADLRAFAPLGLAIGAAGAVAIFLLRGYWRGPGRNGLTPPAVAA